MPRKSSEFHVSSHLIPPNVPPIVHTSLAGHILLHKMGRGWQLPLEQGWPARLNTQTTHTHTCMHILRTSSTFVYTPGRQSKVVLFFLPFHIYIYAALICVPAACNHSCKVPEAASLLWTTGWSSGTQASSAEGGLREGGEDGEGRATTTCQRVSVFVLLWYYWTTVHYISVCMAYQCIHESITWM